MIDSELDRPCWPAPAIALTVAAAYFLGAELGRYLSYPGLVIATVWPPAGIMLGILSRLPARRWVWALAPAAAANLLAGVFLHGRDPLLASGFTAANLAEAALGAWMLQRLVGWPFGLKRATDIGALVLLGGLVAPTVGATLGALVYLADATEPISRLWYTWWTADAIGVVMFAPPVILLSMPGEGVRMRPARLAEAFLLAVATIGLAAAIFGALPIGREHPLRFPMYAVPLVAWAGIRFGRTGASLSSLCVTIFATWGTSRGVGWYAFLELPFTIRMSALQGFNTIVSLTPLLLATVLDEQRRSDRRFRALVSHSPTVVFETDTRGACTYVNERWTQLTGLPTETALGFNWVSVVHEEDRERVVQLWAAATSRQVESPLIECRYTAGDGSTRWVIVNSVAMRGDQGEVVGYLGTILDISDRREAELRLQQAYSELERRVAERTVELTEANTMLRHEIAERIRAEEQLQQQQSQLTHVSRLSTMGQMAAGLAHEVNQPLYAISNYARGMLRRLQAGERPTSETTEVLENVAREAERAGEILRRVRSFIRREDPGFKCVSLNELVHDVVRLTAFEARQRGVAVQLKLEPADVGVLADPIQLQQVLVNLIRNGFEAMEHLSQDRRLVTIETFASDGEVGCAVSDAGDGIPPEDSERIFDPFYTTKAHGLGMGLPISRSLVESFAGRLWVESRPEGGATFRFAMPRAEAQHVGQQERYPADRVPGR